MKSLFRPVIMLLVVCSSLVATAQNFKTPLELNNYFASINDTLYAGGKEWGNKLRTVMDSKAFDSLTPIRTKLQQYITVKQLQLKTMKDVGGSEKFRLAMLDFLNYEEKMMKEAFTPLEKLNKNSTDAEIKTAIDGLINLAGNEEAELKKVHLAQNEYADKNMFKIEDGN